MQTITVDASYFIESQDLGTEWAEKYDQLMVRYRNDISSNSKNKAMSQQLVDNSGF